jgi:Pyruvate/2-oxoacid:ferredoxin oxidoreductase delta subunit
VRACPVDCIKIDTIKAPKDMDLGTTSNGTALRLLVTRFDIDMAECCFCNLCTYPCPEDCIYMTGGPNAHKQPLDYEFSVRNRDGLVFQFATATDDEVARLAETVGVPDPRAQRAARREAYYREEPVAGVAAVEEKEVAATAEEQEASSPVSKTATASEESAPAKKVDLSVLNGISDRTARGKAKAILSRTMRQGGSIKVAADEIRTTLSGLGKLNSEIEEILTKLEN